MTTITFENAAFAEQVKRADSITPKKGEAADKASGIVLDIDPGSEWGVKIRATNTEVYYTEWINHLGVEGEPVTWRMGSQMLTSIMSKLPIGTGKTVTLTQADGALLLVSGRFKAKIGLIDPTYYPSWEPFNPLGTAPVSDLGARINQVGWAVAKNEPGAAMSGIRFDGKTLAATDRYTLASVPCEAPHITREITVPASVIAPLIKQMGDTNVGIVGDQLVFMPNEYTQIRCVILDAKYPNIERVMVRDHTHSVKFQRAIFTDMVNRVVAADQNNRLTTALQVFIGSEEIAFFVAGNTDSAGDVLEVPGQATHPDRHNITFTPSAITNALAASPNEQVELFYDPTNPRKIVRIDGGSGYECWVVPRADIKKAAPAKPEGES